MEKVTVNLPFAGFYGSLYSDAIDREEEQFCEWRMEEGHNDPDYEPYWPEALRLTESELGEILFDVTNYQKAYLELAKMYVDSFDALAGEAFGFTKAAMRNVYSYSDGTFSEEPYRAASLHMTFESMDSPREYNFTTDRVYGELPLAILYLMFRRSRAEGHATLAKVIAERHTSYDGFHSYYSNELENWLGKPLREWDHNELGTLLIAGCRSAGFDAEDKDLALFYATTDAEGASTAWEEGVDWKAFDAKRAERRADKLAEWLGTEFDAAAPWAEHHAEEFASLLGADPSAFKAFGGTLDAIPYRCPLTPDMFGGRADV